VPGPVADSVVVDQEGDRVVVRLRTPLLMGDGVTRSVTVDVDHEVVEEPR
jgi:hypothetical protein